MSSHREITPKLTTFDKSAILCGHPFFRELEAGIREKIGAYATTRNVQRGTTIFLKGDPGTCLFAVYRGTVEMVIPSTEGKSAVINLIPVGEVFGEIALLDGQPRTADAIAFTDCSLMVVERREFLRLLRDRPDVSIKLLEILCARLRRTTEHVAELMFKDVEGRLASTLLRLHKSVGPPHKISITQRDLGELTGVSREEANKQLRIWVQRGLVRLERGAITIIKPEKVEEIAALDMR